MSEPSLAEAFRSQWRVLLALMLREARTRYGRRKAGYFWALVEPLLHMSMLALIFVYIRTRGVPLGESLLVFLATGFPVFFGFRNAMSRVAGAYGSNEALLSFPIVKLMDVFVARALLELATTILVSLIIFGGLIAAGLGTFPHRILLMLAATLLLVAMGFGIGTVLGILSEFVPSIKAFLNLPQRILYFTSGVFYLPDLMFPVVKDVLVWNPIMHGIILNRMGYYDMYESDLYAPGYLVGWAIGSILVAFVIERVARKPIRSLAG